MFLGPGEPRSYWLTTIDQFTNQIRARKKCFLFQTLLIIFVWCQESCSFYKSGWLESSLYDLVCIIYSKSIMTRAPKTEHQKSSQCTSCIYRIVFSWYLLVTKNICINYDHFQFSLCVTIYGSLCKNSDGRQKLVIHMKLINIWVGLTNELV